MGLIEAIGAKGRQFLERSMGITRPEGADRVERAMVQLIRRAQSKIGFVSQDLEGDGFFNTRVLSALEDAGKRGVAVQALIGSNENRESKMRLTEIRVVVFTLEEPPIPFIFNDGGRNLMIKDHSRKDGTIAYARSPMSYQTYELVISFVSLMAEAKRLR